MALNLLKEKTFLKINLKSWRAFKLRHSLTSCTLWSWAACFLIQHWETIARGNQNVVDTEVDLTNDLGLRLEAPWTHSSPILTGNQGQTALNFGDVLTIYFGKNGPYHESKLACSSTDSSCPFWTWDVKDFFRDLTKIFESYHDFLWILELRGHVQGGAGGAWAPPLFEIY